MGNLWSRGKARASLMGHEKTSNPTPAASALLRSGLGRKRVAKALRSLGRRRRSFYRGNPVPALAALAASKIPGIKNLFKTGSDKRAAGVAGQLVSAAVQGNLTAARAILERQEIGIRRERAVWVAAAKQIPPNILELVKKYHDEIPGVDHSTPESAANDALSRPVNGLELEKAAKDAAAAAAAEARAERRAGAAASEARRERTEARLTELGTAGLGALARGARRPVRRRRKKRRSSGREFSF